jgi:Ca2+-binding EF-hand superfamily protein
MLRIPCQAALVLALAVAGLAVARGQEPSAAKPPPAEPDHRDVDRFFDEHDKNKKGFLTKDDLPQRLRHAFERIDTNKDGKISREELRHGFPHLQPRRRPSDVAFVLAEMSDVDEQTVAELQRMYDLLRKLDRDKDGKINLEDLKALRQQIVSDRVDALIRELDTDKDGKISRAEAKGEILKDFDQLDLNKDGYIDRDELLKAASAKHPTAPGRTPPSDGQTGAQPRSK